MSLSASPGHVPQTSGIKIVRRYLKVTTSPDVFINNYKEEEAVQEMLSQLPAREQFNHWKRVEVDGKKNMKLLTADMEKTQFGRLLEDTSSKRVSSGSRDCTCSWRLGGRSVR